jgi:2-hydroxy-3-oxopropionate reductase
MAPKFKIGFVGLGVMGFPMAGHLSRAGHQVTVFNRTPSKAQQWLGLYEGQMASTPAECAEGQDLVMVCVGNDEDLKSVLLAEQGALSTMTAGALLIDHTTVSAKVTQELAALAQQKGVGFLDAPVSGGQAGAEQGQLTIMVGGQAAQFQQAEPVLAHYAKRMVHVGDSGSGQLAKMVNQICLAGAIQGLAEGLHFAKAVNLDVPKVLQAISKGAAQSWQMDHRAQTMLADDYDHGFAVDWMRKDLNIALEQAIEVQAHLPMTRMVDQFYAEVQTMGGQRWDTSSLLRRLDALDESNPSTSSSVLNK